MLRSRPTTTAGKQATGATTTLSQSALRSQCFGLLTRERMLAIRLPKDSLRATPFWLSRSTHWASSCELTASNGDVSSTSDASPQAATSWGSAMENIFC